MSDPVVGNTIDVPITITDNETGDLVDPTTIEAFVTSPNQSEAQYAFPDFDHLVRTGPGAYLLSWLADDDGRWFWRIETTGAGEGIGDGFIDVRPLLSSTGGPAPESATPELDIVIGDDYKLVDGRAFEWAGALWPAIDAAAITVKFRRHQTKSPIITVAGSVASARKVRLELDAVDTRKLTAGRYSYAVQAALTDDNVATLATGTANVTAAP